ncbi:MAG: GNAT family N-acetyltransferase [Beijerinckiaceae bacterium]|nr:GNAT family N-acetyltransferase [Beijerinckiaceae bacterium]
MNPGKVVLIRGWVPGIPGWVIAEHGRSYARDWQFGAGFEAKVAEAMGEWLGRYDPGRDLLLTAMLDDKPVGSISLDGSGPHVAGEGARIRFFILAEAARGLGIGRRLMGEMMAFIEETGFDRVFLTTFRGLDAARHLYEAEGFRLVAETRDSSWGRPLDEQLFRWEKPRP